MRTDLFIILMAGGAPPPPVYATWDATLTYGGTYTYSNGNKTLATSGARKCARSTIGMDSGIHAIELTVADHWGNSSFGFVRDDAVLTAGAVGFTGAVGNSIGNYQNSIFRNGTDLGGGDIGCADGVPAGYILDLTNGRFKQHGTLTNDSGWIALPAGYAGHTWYFAASYIDAAASSIIVNSGETAFSSAFQTLMTASSATAWPTA